MRIEAEVRGLAEFQRRLDALRGAKDVVGEVYLDNARAVELARYHASDEPRSKMPLRNPFFIDAHTRERVMRTLQMGVRDILRGASSGLVQAMKDATGVVVDKFRRNIGNPSGARVGRSASVGYPSSGTLTTDGEKMKPLTKAYAAIKRAKWGARPILVASGGLYDSIAGRVRRGA